MDDVLFGTEVRGCFDEHGNEDRDVVNIVSRVGKSCFIKIIRVGNERSKEEARPDSESGVSE